MRSCWPLLLLAFLLTGCTENPTPDQHPEVFKTIGEVAADRRSEYEQRWQETALALLHSDRPDIQSQPLGEGRFGVILEADGVRREVDLSPLVQKLGAQTGQSELILRQALRPELIALDQERLLTSNLDALRPHIDAIFLSEADLRQRSAQWSGSGTLHAVLVAPELYWAPIVRLGSTDAAIAFITQPVIDHWRTSTADLDRLALLNLKRDWNDNAFETTNFDPLGRVGTLKQGINPAVVMLPEFLSSVQRQWKTSDDLALLMSSPTSVRFLPAKNTRLLDMIYPQWERSTQDLLDPLSKRVLLASPKGISLMAYNPPVRLHGLPGTPPTSRPVFQPPDPLKNLPNRRLPTSRPYIVR